MLCRFLCDILKVQSRTKYDLAHRLADLVTKKGEKKMAAQTQQRKISEFEKNLIPAMVRYMQELPAEMQGFLVGYAKCEADKLREKADERQG